MSGMVKIYAQCPTWENLTALEYHFASTCIPTSEAWWLHSLPPFILRFSVAVMFLFELVTPFFLLVPIRIVREVAAVTQVILQIAIMLTGNYNWFNIHTCILLIPIVAPDIYDIRKNALGKIFAYPLMVIGEFLRRKSMARLFRDLTVVATCYLFYQYSFFKRF